MKKRKLLFCSYHSNKRVVNGTDSKNSKASTKDKHLKKVCCYKIETKILFFVFRIVKEKEEDIFRKNC